MVWKKTHDYRMDFESRQHFAAPALMGVAFFLRAVYYFGFTRPETVGAWNLIIFLILPMLLEAAFMVLMRGMRYNAPGMYGILGAVYCLLLMLQSFQTGSVVRIILSVIAYLVCGAALVVVTGGLLSRGVAVTALFVTLAVRFLFFDLSGYVFSFRIVGFIREAAALCGILGLGLLSLGLKEKTTKK
jgi:uncharacterized MnhB-related membrane protein